MSDLQAITSRPWANLASYTDAEWHVMYSTLFDGSEGRGPLLNGLNDFEVTESNPVGMTVEVATGVAKVGGVWCQNETAQTLTIAANGGGANRYDLVFLHWTRATQVVNLRVVDGTAATCATAVAPAANAIATYQAAGPPVTEWAIPLACITVAPGATQIVNGDITDLREFSRYRTAAGDIADGTSIDTTIVPGLTPAMTDAGALLQIADDGVNIDQVAAAVAGAGLAGGAGTALSVDAATVAGDGLTGAGAVLAVNPGTGLEVVGDQVRIATSAAGDGLTGGGGAALAANVDAATITIVGDQLQVGTVGSANISDRTRYIWIGANEMHLAVGSGATWGSIGAQPACAEGWVFPPGTTERVIVHFRFPTDWGPVGHTKFVWSHSLTTGSYVYTVWWLFEYNPSYYSYPSSLGYYSCGDTVLGTSNRGWARCTNEVTASSGNQRLCNASQEVMLCKGATGAGSYADIALGRDGARVEDNYPDSVVLLGVLLPYTADM